MVEAETTAVNVAVLQVERAYAGRLLALAEVEIEIDGIVIVLHGVRVVDLGPRSLGVEPPAWRAGAQSRAAISLPEELTATIADAVLDAYEAAREMFGCRRRRGWRPGDR